MPSVALPIPDAVSSRRYGVKADAVSVSDAAITSGDATLTSATAAFTAADVGKVVAVAGAGAAGATLATSIASVTNATTVELTANASTSVIGAYASYGTDDTTALNTWLTAVSAEGPGAVGFLHGLCMATGQVTQKGGTTIRGSGWDYVTVSQPPRRGSGIIWAGSPSVGYLFGDISSVASGSTSPLLEDVTLFGYGLPTSLIRSLATRSRAHRVQAFWGGTNCFLQDGQNGRIYDCVLGQNLNGYVVRVNVTDVKVSRSEVRQGGIAQIYMKNTSNLMLQDNHVYTGANGDITGVPDGCVNVLVENGGASAQGLLAVGNTFDATPGPHFKIMPTSANRFGFVTITGNEFYQVTGFIAGSYPIVDFDCSTSGGTIRDVAFVGNVFFTLSSTDYSYILKKTGSATLAGVVCVGNVGGNVNQPFNGFRPDCVIGNSWINHSASTQVQSSASGKNTASGNGSATTFSWNHGISDTPSVVNVTPGSSAARGDYHVTASLTQITVTYATAPASGTNNVVHYWTAEV